MGIALFGPVKNQPSQMAFLFHTKWCFVSHITPFRLGRDSPGLIRVLTSMFSFKNSSILAIHGYDHSATDADIVLESDPCAFHLADAGFPAELPDKFGALGKARGAQWMALGKQTS